MEPRRETSLTTALPLSFLFSVHLCIIGCVVFLKRAADMLIVTNHRRLFYLLVCYYSSQCHLDAIRYSFTSGSHFRTSLPRGSEAPVFQARHDRGPLLLPSLRFWNRSKISPVPNKGIRPVRRHRFTLSVRLGLS